MMKLLAHLDRRLVPPEGTDARYLRVQLIAPDRPHATDRLPLNLALVLDRSGSMAGSKLDKAKEAAIFCLRNLTAADRVAVIAYDDEVRVVAPSRALTPSVKAGLIAEVRKIESGGSTNLGGGWLTGAQEVANYQHEANYLSRTILLSDGLANVGITDPDELAHHAGELRARGVSTTTMGIGADFQEDLLEQMALRGGGHFYFIEDARQIPDFLHRELGEVLSTCARQVVVTLDVPDGVDARLLNAFEIERNGGLRVRLDDMIAGEARSVVFKLAVPSGREGVTLPVGVRLSYLDVDSRETRTMQSGEAVFTYASPAACAAEAADTSVVEEVALLQVARAREEALRYDAAGQYAQSAATLAQAATYLRAAAPASPMAQAEAQALDADSTEAQRGFGQIKRKALHYAKTTRLQNRNQ
jgi:Ca-activated chloride channel family protein